MDTQIIRITYRLIAEMEQYPEDCRAWTMLENKYWTYFCSQFIEAQSDLREQQQTSLQGVYRANILVRIEEAFANLTQSIAEDRASVTNLSGSNMNLKTQVAEYANHMANNKSAMAKMQKKIIQMKG